MHRPNRSDALLRAFAVVAIVAAIAPVDRAGAVDLTAVQSPWLAIDRNRDSIVTSIVVRWQDTAALRRSHPDALAPEQLREALSKLRADHLFSASLAGTYPALIGTLTEAGAFSASISPAKTTLKTGNTAPELAYTPITPCRIVDSRTAVGGTPAAGATRNWLASNPGGSFTAQGGSATNCGIPIKPTALAVNITIFQNGAGPAFLVAWPFNQPKPTSATLNWVTPGTQLANSAIVPLCTGAGCTSDFSVFFSQATNVVVDAVGYFSSPSGGNVLSVAPSGAQYSSIQAAIDAASALVVASGNTQLYLVRVAPGVYNEQITLKDNVDVEGSGRDITGITFSGAAPTVFAGAQSTMSKFTVFNDFNPLAVAIGQTGNTPNGFTALEDMVLQAGGVGSNTAVNITGGTIHILRSDASTGVGNASTVQIALRGAGAGSNIRYVNGRLLPHAGGDTQLAASQESGAIVKIDNTELRATTSGAPLCFATFQQNYTLANCP